ncbi:BRO family protein [Pseudomonas sp. NPDC079086]|uniref:BRO family protein n=1 Tax=unclassified Pseudomonas TaxID=196821 RepID=UPI0037CB8FAC
MQTAQVIPFSFEANQVRTAIVEGEPWFAVKDIIRSLDYSKASAPAKLVDAVPVQWKGVNPIHTPGGSQKLLMLSEQGLYFFLGRSDKPKALPFQMWLAGEVLPAIRKHGSYADTHNKMGTLLGETIGTNGFNMLGSLIKGKVVSLPAVNRAKATAKIWSQTHAAFGVRSGADIPASQLDAARNFIAAYALEGEWLPKQEEVVGVLALDVYQANSLTCLLHYVDWVNYRWHQGIAEAVKALNPDFYSHTWEFFRELHQSAKQLEKSPEIAALCKTGNAKRPHECAAAGLSA